MNAWSVIDGLDELTGTGPGPRPELTVVSRNTGANVVRLAFRNGQVMADHSAARPILVIGQRGDVDFTIEGQTIRLRPGRAIHVEAGVSHALAARTDAAVTLLILENPDGVGVPPDQRDKILDLLSTATTTFDAADVAARLGLHVTTARFHLNKLVVFGSPGR